MYQKFCDVVVNLTTTQIYWIGASSVSMGISMQQVTVMQAIAVEFVALGIFAVSYAVGLAIAENDRE